MPAKTARPTAPTKTARRTAPIATRLMPEERQLIRRAAVKAGMGISTYLRVRGLAAARKDLANA